MLIEKLIEYALPRSQGKRIRDVRAGLGYTCLALDDGTAGLAYTFRNDMGPFCGILSEAGTINGRDAAEVIPWAGQSHRLKAAIGLAAINAVLNNEPGTAWEDGNIIEALSVGEEDAFGMVGDFAPIVMNVKKKTNQLYIFELDPPEGSGFYPSEEIPLYLPKCSVVVITATSIVNHTIDGILAHCESAREICIIGPSTPMCPALFRDLGVTMLAGTLVTDPDKALEIVGQGGGTMALQPVSRRVLARL
jgi:uncharacterized protein (DUF4213/DUF364 family)